jgi:cyclophilin family peptidyl-prolyl cis-trans isomerase
MPFHFRPCWVRLVTGLSCLVASVVTPRAAAADTPPLPPGLYADFSTPRGAFVAELFYDKTPMTCASFVGRAEGTLAPREGKPFFTGLRWYRVVPGFVIQSGDPTTPQGGIQERAARGEKEDDAAGHPFPFPDEFVPGLRHDAAGMLSMANGGPDTNSSEFFLTLAPTNRLNYLHSVFGRVVRGLEVLPKIQPDDALAIKIVRVGATAQAFKADEAGFRARVAAAKKYADVPTAKSEPGPGAHFDDPAGLLPVDPARAKNFNFKLANFERATGVRIVARIFAHSPSAAEDAKPGAYMHALAEKLGTARRGALACYFADEDDWRVWVGDESTAAFAGRPLAPADLGEGAALHQAKEAFLNAAHDTGDADFARQKAAAPPDRPPAPGQRIKLQTDEILDGLILKLEPK